MRTFAKPMDGFKGLDGLKDAVSQSRFWLRKKWHTATGDELHLRLLRHVALLEMLEESKD